MQFFDLLCTVKQHFIKDFFFLLLFINILNYLENGAFKGDADEKFSSFNKTSIFI